MPTFNGPVAEFFLGHHGIATTCELAGLGIGLHERRELLAAGVVLPVFEGVYRLASSPLTFEARCRAVCAADHTLTLCCFTAGTLMGLRRCGSPWIHAVTGRTTKPVGASVKVHRTTLDLSERIVVRDDGIRYTDALQTFFDLAKHVDDLALRSIGEQIIADGRATHDELAGYVSTIAHAGRPGTRRALRVIRARQRDGGAAESDGEAVLLDALHAAGLVDFVRHPPVALRDGTVVHPDLGVPAIGLYVEVDHHTWHTQVADVEYDKQRDREIRIVGGEVERVPTSQIAAGLTKVVADLTLRYIQRRTQVGVESRWHRT